MNKFICYFLISTLMSCIYVKNKAISDNRTAEFMAFFIKHELKKKSITLLDEEFKLDAQSKCVIDVVARTNNLFQLQEVIADTAVLWNEKIVSNSLIISKKDLPNNSQNTWHSFKQKIGSDFFIISRPIFSSDENFVFIYSAYYCGDRCGNESLKLFKRENDSWVLINVYCEKES